MCFGGQVIAWIMFILFVIGFLWWNTMNFAEQRVDTLNINIFLLYSFRKMNQVKKETRVFICNIPKKCSSSALLYTAVKTLWWTISMSHRRDMNPCIRGRATAAGPAEQVACLSCFNCHGHGLLTLASWPTGETAGGWPGEKYSAEQRWKMIYVGGNKQEVCCCYCADLHIENPSPFFFITFLFPYHC